jgi:hypothetical protein
MKKSKCHYLALKGGKLRSNIRFTRLIRGSETDFWEQHFESLLAVCPSTPGEEIEKYQ